MHACVGVEFVLELVASSFVLTVVTRVSQVWPSNALVSNADPIFVARYYFCFATEDRMLAGQIVGADISVNNRLKVCGSWHMQYCIRTYQVSNII